ncbi:3-deoxy-7-phosphoheptulonate synthase [Enterobacteriaceae endosymbiont of Donacia tomentosa]|uniref:3-deoxy-7-phosphoheptulonate synthase n=1 Tax=Enterobacteriaceae endosymbiont of Donacia tomentosa TaxID=2675787 RepID=UPI0014494520|nr:3-deoxy-7-phosphoheptulonate synthase [Enterobacteriaceae endosymbiont of Donacia tomentosa]QJC31806.1 3-deoxy-7-phosphoheptulonate synthase [Enterobacteriaceae endosymbiont of Donacia tomentosa]
MQKNNSNIEKLITPKELKNKLPISKKLEDKILISRQTICNIISGKDPRILVVCGPCSIHNIEEAIEYSNFFSQILPKIKNSIYLVMRVYFEKPRTTIGWKGLINDPDMNNSFNINKGLYLARQLLIKLVKNDILLATEILDPNTTPYITDLISWVAIGARTVESQIHREIASSLRIPVGFKNNTDGNIISAINAIKSAATHHSFISLDEEGKACIIRTLGNKNCHIILRGGLKPNYHENDVKKCEQYITKAKLSSKIMIDCSHGNSNKDYKQQIKIINSIISQISNGNKSIVGIMIESYINEGNQIININNNLNKIKYGVSITDGCINWENTKIILYKIHNKLKKILPLRSL